VTLQQDRVRKKRRVLNFEKRSDSDIYIIQTQVILDEGYDFTSKRSHLSLPTAHHNNLGMLFEEVRD
jgi:hypothetical protein